jgi:hypothetical protein
MATQPLQSPSKPGCVTVATPLSQKKEVPGQGAVQVRPVADDDDRQDLALIEATRASY